MITEDYVSFKTAKLLKEKGFDEYGMYFYTLEDEGEEGYKSNRRLQELAHNSHPELEGRAVSCPTLQMAVKWLREKKGIAVIPVISSVLDNEKFLWDVKVVVAKTNDTYSQGWIYEKQEDACERAVEYCLEKLI